ncbi:MAG: hypothetical protein H0T99_13215 [Geodermatophilaceae bacterium]|nr:hypothetical protein [Geodermatophilaceae bacterium]MDQ3475021.1 hypothetical protein [Actinomycetota bacterium]
MSYRAWPAALLGGASLATACLVVGDHVVATSDGCLDAAGWFTAAPVSWSPVPDAVGGEKPAANSEKVDLGAAGGADVMGHGDTTGAPTSGSYQISGCLDLDRLEVPAPAPAPDGRA